MTKQYVVKCTCPLQLGGPRRRAGGGGRRRRLLLRAAASGRSNAAATTGGVLVQVVARVTDLAAGVRAARRRHSFAVAVATRPGAAIRACTVQTKYKMPIVSEPTPHTPSVSVLGRWQSKDKQSGDGPARPKMKTALRDEHACAHSSSVAVAPTLYSRPAGSGSQQHKLPIVSNLTPADTCVSTWRHKAIIYDGPAHSVCAVLSVYFGVLKPIRRSLSPPRRAEAGTAEPARRSAARSTAAPAALFAGVGEGIVFGWVWWGFEVLVVGSG